MTVGKAVEDRNTTMLEDWIRPVEMSQSSYWVEPLIVKGTIYLDLFSTPQLASLAITSSRALKSQDLQHTQQEYHQFPRQTLEMGKGLWRGIKLMEWGGIDNKRKRHASAYLYCALKDNQANTEPGLGLGVIGLQAPSLSQK
ncbi:hypothetical protein RRG08_017382 [Elysia crispata]|uniref:Uncharacterized protein n=1 Tax=Elysia crispata TaxID=231223 RepID=A0AAE1DQ19_9GAST|nr:hypothetical protein RRG08_017382 [Elysia crispata]